jgi:hypothetical protein
MHTTDAQEQFFAELDEKKRKRDLMIAAFAEPAGTEAAEPPLVGRAAMMQRDYEESRLPAGAKAAEASEEGADATWEGDDPRSAFLRREAEQSRKPASGKGAWVR